jgi:hypothetical protein
MSITYYVLYYLGNQFQSYNMSLERGLMTDGN